VASFPYSSNITLDFVYFFAIAALIGLLPSGKKEYTLKPSSTITLAVTLIFTIVFILGMGLLILGGQRYVAEIYYYKGLTAYQAGQKTDGLKNLVKAANLNSQSDLYFRQLSQAYLLDFQGELQAVNSTPSEQISDQEKAKIQTLWASSVNAAVKATDLNPQDVGNWSSRGYVYQSLLGITNGAATWAINSYDSALKLDPNSPYLFFQEGSVYLAEATASSIDQALKNQLLAKAQGQLEKAVNLNPNYPDAWYSLGIIYDFFGQKNKAIDAFTKLQQLNPTNTDITKVLNNLKAGRSAFQSITPSVQNVPSGTTDKAKN